MAYNPANVSEVTPSLPMGFRLINYNAGADTLADVENVGYFTDNLNIRPGDILRVTASDGKRLYVIDGSGPPAERILADDVNTF